MIFDVAKFNDELYEKYKEFLITELKKIEDQERELR